MCIQEWLGLVFNFHLMHILLSYSQLGQILRYIGPYQSTAEGAEIWFGCNTGYLLGKWDHHSWLI